MAKMRTNTTTTVMKTMTTTMTMQIMLDVYLIVIS
jgi:hypothetical protein